MKITKFGHCCLLIEVNGLRILTDPGNLTTEQETIKHIDVILITHEHSDHFHVPSLALCLANNPKARIITNKSVAALIDEHGIKVDYDVVADTEHIEIKGVLIEGYGTTHAEIYDGIVTPAENTGYFISNKLFYPGDALTKPDRKIDVLALPVAGPWINIRQSMDYALELKPRTCFPVHDGILKQIGTTNVVPPKVLGPKGINFIVLELSKSHQF